MPPISQHPFRILVADDEEEYLKLYSQVLSADSPFNTELSAFELPYADGYKSKFEITSCRQGDSAVDEVKQSIVENRPFSVAFLDVRMPPGPDGIWVAKQIRQIDPQIEIAIVTGYSDYSPEDIVSRVPPVHKLIYIQKPFRLKEIYHFANVLSAKRHQEHNILNINKRLEHSVAERTKELDEKNKNLNESKKKLQALYSHLITAQEEERKRIASDLHDDLGQTLAMLKLRIQSIQKKLPQDQCHLKKECDETLQHVNNVIEHIRRIAHDLSPAALQDLGLVEALKSLADEFSKHARIKLILEIAKIDKLLPLTSEVIIYRVFQEILTNIQKHASTEYVKIKVKKEQHHISFLIKDGGKGFDKKDMESKPVYGKGLGLSSMDERIKMLNGQMTIKSGIGIGTSILFIIPY